MFTIVNIYKINLLNNNKYFFYNGHVGIEEHMTRIHDYIAYEFGKESEEYKNAAKIRY